VREFLEFFQLDFTVSVFDPETAQGKYYKYGGRSKLMKDLHIENLNGM
jgi:FGFR1 oncogene partner